MLKLLFAEFKYNVWFIVVMYGLFSLLNIDVQMESGEDINFVFWILPFLLVNIIIARHDREKRIRLGLLIPVKVIHLGAERILMVVIPILFYYVIAVGLEAIFSFATLKTHMMSYLMGCNLLILAYSMYFVIYDYLGNINTSESVRTTLKIIIINSSLVFLIVLIFYSYMAKIVWLTMLVNLGPLVALLSVFTFTRRKTYLE